MKRIILSIIVFCLCVAEPSFAGETWWLHKSSFRLVKEEINVVLRLQSEALMKNLIGIKRHDKRYEIAVRLSLHGPDLMDQQNSEDLEESHEL